MTARTSAGRGLQPEFLRDAVRGAPSAMCAAQCYPSAIVAIVAMMLALALFGAGSDAPEAHVVFDAPTAATMAPVRLRASLPASDPADVFVEALDFDTLVHGSARRDTWGRGVLRRGTVLPAVRRWWSTSCGGYWVELAGGGGVCDRDGVRMREAADTPAELTLAPDLGVDLPYRYARAVAEGTPRLSRLPTARELAKLPASVPHERTRGVVFVALDRPHTVGDVVFYRTLEGDFIAEDALVHVEAPQTAGQPIFSASLPIAFVVGESVPVHHRAGEAIRPFGVAERTARFEVAGIVEIEGTAYVESDEGALMQRSDIRLAERIAPPSDVTEDERWIHIDLDEQILVAYEGARPVYVTLVSTGKSGYETPAGTYRIRRKYVSRRMRGPDPETGSYDIAEVPWVMYYHRGYALHGAYWHDEFGKVRSHGCTNIPPQAARWLFQWTAPEVPAGWHGVFVAGTRLVLTRD